MPCLSIEIVAGIGFMLTVAIVFEQISGRLSVEVGRGDAEDALGLDLALLLKVFIAVICNMARFDCFTIFVQAPDQIRQSVLLEGNFTVNCVPARFVI